MRLRIAHTPKVVKKGDRFMVYGTITNETEAAITLKKVKVDPPPGFIGVKKKQNVSVLDIKANLSKAFDQRLPLELEEVVLEESIGRLIQPHESYPFLFMVKAGWSASPFYPRPETYTLSVIVEYEPITTTTTAQSGPTLPATTFLPSRSNIGNSYFASESIDLSLFPSFGSMLTGALAGALLGTIVRNSEKVAQIPVIVNQAELVQQIMGIFIVPLIFGLIAGLILMRKKDVQPFLTIEDFWGGIVVGFAVGYGGSDIVTRLLPSDLGSASNSTGGT